MGLPMSLDLRAPDEPRARAAVQEAFAVLHAADARFSRHRPDSELCRFRRGAVARPSRDLSEVLEIAQAAHAASGGAFDVRRPDGALDTDGVVKGWAAQRAVDRLVAAGFHDLCLNAGGDVAVRGGPEPGRGWVVGVRSPTRADELVARIEVRDGAVATSGTYERGEHVWDGRTGEAARGLCSATVVAADLTTADVLATSVLALGREGFTWALDHGAALVVAVLPDGTVLSHGPGGRAEA